MQTLKLFARNSDLFQCENVSDKFVSHRGRSDRNGWLRADKEAADAGKGGASRLAVRSSRLGRNVSRGALHATDHV